MSRRGLLGGAAACLMAGGKTVKAEQTPPISLDWVLPTLDGTGSGSLAAFRGKKVLLVQFASW
ncbi:MAG: hypothetical protein OHK0029_23730 [Armatimonadaceae bacterium]